MLPNPAQPRATASRRRATVLVVDDRMEVGRQICRILRRDGYDAIPVRQGMDAHWCLDRAERVDLVISQLLPPEPDGYHLGIPYRRALPHTPALFLSPAPREENIRRGLLHPRAAFLMEPFPPQLLLRRVRQLLSAWRAAPAA